MSWDAMNTVGRAAASEPQNLAAFRAQLRAQRVARGFEQQLRGLLEDSPAVELSITGPRPVEAPPRAVLPGGEGLQRFLARLAEPRGVSSADPAGARVLERPAPGEPRPRPASPSPASPSGSTPAGGVRTRFLEAYGESAREAAESLGLSPTLLLAHAALETGWGRRLIRGADGEDCRNLFALKAGPSWTGRTVELLTTEYVGGLPVQRRERFRAYDSHAEAFADYARLLRRRYRAALDAGDSAEAFGNALQAGGYATDPAYALKLARVSRSMASDGSA